MTDHPAPNPNQPDALVDGLFDRIEGAIIEVRDAYPRRPDDAPSSEVAEAVMNLLAAVWPEVERRAKASGWDEGQKSGARWGGPPLDAYEPDPPSSNPYREKGDDRG